jgi:hypothetical protein
VFPPHCHMVETMFEVAFCHPVAFPDLQLHLVQTLGSELPWVLEVVDVAQIDDHPPFPSVSLGNCKYGRGLCWFPFHLFDEDQTQLLLDMVCQEPFCNVWVQNHMYPPWWQLFCSKCQQCTTLQPVHDLSGQLQLPLRSSEVFSKM